MSAEQRLGWVIPKAPDGTIVTVSRTQFAPQADRFGPFAQLSQAATLGDFATRLREVLARPVEFLSTKDRAAGEVESPEARQKREFLTFLFGDKQNGEVGLISSSYKRGFARRLNGVEVIEPSHTVKMRFTHDELQAATEEAESTKDSNRWALKTALDSFDQNVRTMYVDSAGKFHEKPEKTYRSMDAVHINGEWVPTGRIIGAFNIIQTSDVKIKARKIQVENALTDAFGHAGISVVGTQIEAMAANIATREAAGDSSHRQFEEAREALGIPDVGTDISALREFLKRKSTKKFFDAGGYVVQDPQEAYEVKEVVEVDIVKPAIKAEGDATVAPNDARNIFNVMFSTVNRSAGSKIAGVPATILDESTHGVVVHDLSAVEPIKVEYEYGERKGENTFALFPREVRIGQPYAETMQQATALVAQAVDTVARHLEEYVGQQGRDGRSTVPVEEVADYALRNLEQWLAQGEITTVDAARSRSHLQMDFFFLPPLEVRQTLIEDAAVNNGFLSEEARALLERETQAGNLLLTIFDISGGAGGTGVSEKIAQMTGLETSGYTEAYIQSLIETYMAKEGRLPETVAICPREADLTLIALEYIPLVEKLRNQGMDAHIVLAEELEQSLAQWNGDGAFQVMALDGQMVSPELIAKRFTFLGAGLNKNGDRGHIRTHLPDGVHIVPAPVSRVPASDKRINSRILDILEPQLREMGIEVVPTATLPIVDRGRMEILETAIRHAEVQDGAENAAMKQTLVALRTQYVHERAQVVTDQIVDFFSRHAHEWPEVGFLGGVLKIDDKRPGREGKGGELVSAYPIPAGILKVMLEQRSPSEMQIDLLNGHHGNQEEQQRIREYVSFIVTQKLITLVENGALSVVVQPNLFTGFGRGDDLMETKMIAYAG